MSSSPSRREARGFVLGIARAWGLLWRAAPRLFATNLVLSIVQSALPLAALYLLKLIVDAIAAAADKRGMRVVLPSAAALTSSGITAAELQKVSPAKLTSIVAPQGGEVALMGRLVWNDRDLGWVTQYRMAWRGRDYTWQFRGVSFDEAFRRGIGGAAQVLSGNGDPGRSK